MLGIEKKNTNPLYAEDYMSRISLHFQNQPIVMGGWELPFKRPQLLWGSIINTLFSTQVGVHTFAATTDTPQRSHSISTALAQVSPATCYGED